MSATLPTAASDSFAEARANSPVSAEFIVDYLHTDPPGSADTRSALDSADQPPWTRRLPILRSVVLDAAPQTSVPLRTVLATRRSKTPATPADLSVLLTLTSTLATTNDSGTDAACRAWTSRANPSAGGTHSISLLLHQADPEDRWYIPTAPHHRTAVTADMVDIAPATASTLTAATTACAPIPPPACLYLIADTARLFARYPRGTSLLWRDAGALAATAHLIATDLGLASTILGCGGQHLERAPYPAVLVGAVALGH